MNTSVRSLLQRLTVGACCLVLGSFVTTAMAWDSVGHRISAAVAVELIDAETRNKLLDILAAHPRYQQDFIAQMPGFVDREDELALASWLLGQAAYWPDIARGLPDTERRRFNRPPWHYTDGAWVRGAAQSQGNQYTGIAPFPDINGEDANSINSESDAHNVVTALDYNSAILADNTAEPSARAVALCWVLHLIGDIHQPLHTGSMYSARVFENGDLGGNRIPIGNSNLHAEWDGALREQGVAASLPMILEQLRNGGGNSASDSLDWTAWMAESRQYLLTQVYTEAMRDAIRLADSNDSEEISTQSLSTDYRYEMQAISRLRLGLAGQRLANWFANELP